MIDFITGYVKHVRDHLYFRKKLKAAGLPMTKDIGLFVNKDGDFVYASPLLSPMEYWQLRRDLIKSRQRSLERKSNVIRIADRKPKGWSKHNTTH